MNMEQVKLEGKGDALPGDTLERIEVAANGQIELCIAARLILDQSKRIHEIASEPEVLALQGIISALAARAKDVLHEVEVEYSEGALKCLHS